jgi:hypothetical protein
VTANSLLQFSFDYITSDGSGFPDYAWAALENISGDAEELIFSAQTTPTGNTVPGGGLPLLAPGVTLIPAATPIKAGSGTQCGTSCNSPAGGPVWDAIGTWSGNCYAVGCGTTGWIQEQLTIVTAGTYQLAFGVSNANDGNYDSALAYAGVEVNGVPISGAPEPNSSTLMLLGTVLGLLGHRLKKSLRKNG